MCMCVCKGDTKIKVCEKKWGRLQKLKKGRRGHLPKKSKLALHLS